MFHSPGPIRPPNWFAISLVICQTYGTCPLESSRDISYVPHTGLIGVGGLPSIVHRTYTAGWAPWSKYGKGFEMEGIPVSDASAKSNQLFPFRFIPTAWTLSTRKVCHIASLTVTAARREYLHFDWKHQLSFKRVWALDSY